MLVASAYLVSALGPGSLSINHWAGIDNWMGIPWAAPDAVRAGARVGVGVAAGLLALAAGLAGKALRGKAPHSLDHPLHT
jgi:hypothetical protein